MNNLELAEMRYAWPGGYEIFFICKDGGLLCSPCVVKEWDECISTAVEDCADDWNIVSMSHTGQLDERESCDNCWREFQP